ncbi:MAG TPA: CocE/NonD family hydrolase [Vicinamibacteria bacterium]|nr:CocE/NonD family hydrolase [Vicinamibacteria bacterium]
MTTRGLRATLTLALLSLLAVSVRAADLGPLPVTVGTGLKVPMRDGVALAADVYRPAGEGRFPVLLTRTPYDRRDPQTGLVLASHGYVVVLQDTRGRFGSEGEFSPFRNEAADGYDTVEWAAVLPYANGKVGMFGGSYVGATQMLAAMGHPPHLVAIQPYVTASEYYEGWTYQGGALMEWFVSSWSSGLAVDTLRRKAEALAHPRDWVETVPMQDYRLLDLPTVASLAPYLREWMAHPTRDAYWRDTRVSDHYGEMTVKGLHRTGWHDIFSRGAIENFMGLRAQAATPEARAGQRLMVGPWAHGATSLDGKIGDVAFGMAAVVDENELLLKWAAFTLKDEANEYATGAPVRLFVMGDNAWRDEQEFPLARAQSTRYYLHAAKGANSISGDGALSTKAPRQERPDQFDYDPAKPVRTLGGRLCCGVQYLPGPADQRPNESRPDVLVYSTPPLDHDLEVTGFITAEIQAATSAVDTDFTAMLVDVDPGGYARYLADGIVRARYRHSREQAEPLVPGRIETYAIDLWATSNVFKAGHRLRLYVSSSNFPRFDRNPNTGEPAAAATRQAPAHQTVYHDAAHPSALILPVIPRP